MQKNKLKIISSDIRKILFIRNDKIGDLVVSSNIISLLKKQFPCAEIDVVVSEQNKQLIEGDKSIKNIYILNYSPRKPNEFAKYLNLAKKIRKNKYDLGIEARGSLINIFFLLFLGRVKYTIGFYTTHISKYFLDSAYYKDFKGHASKNMIKMMNKGLGIKSSFIWPEIITSKEDKKELDLFIKKNKISKSISLCIEASEKRKQWPLDHFDKIIKYLHEEKPEYKILLIGMDKNKLDYLTKRNPFCIQLCEPNLRFLYLLFRKNNLVITTDGGLMHLAWVSKAKLIALIPTHVILEDIEPLGKNSKIIYKPIKEIGVKEVKILINDLLD